MDSRRHEGNSGKCLKRHCPIVPARHQPGDFDRLGNSAHCTRILFPVPFKMMTNFFSLPTDILSSSFRSLQKGAFLSKSKLWPCSPALSLWVWLMSSPGWVGARKWRGNPILHHVTPTQEQLTFSWCFPGISCGVFFERMQEVVEELGKKSHCVNPRNHLRFRSVLGVITV